MQASNEKDVSEGDVTHTLEVPLSLAKTRIDKALATLLPQYSRARLQAWIDEGHVTHNGAVSRRRRATVNVGDTLVVQAQADPQASFMRAEEVDFEVVAQSPHWLVVNKPAGLVVHPGAGNWSGTLLNGLLHRYPHLAEVERAGLVHRLDKDTSGLMVVALSESARQHLIAQLQARSVSREYVALAHGAVVADVGSISTDIGRDARVPVRMSVHNPIAPKPARTDYEVVARAMLGDTAVTQLACHLHTGRTHQIRVHLSSLGHPLLGDSLYGAPRSDVADRQMLHARRLAFDDPASGERQTFECAPPPDMQALLDQMLVI